MVVVFAEIAFVGPPPLAEDGAVLWEIQFSIREREGPMPDFGAELRGLAEKTDD